MTSSMSNCEDDAWAAYELADLPWEHGVACQLDAARDEPCRWLPDVNVIVKMQRIAYAIAPRAESFRALVAIAPPPAAAPGADDDEEEEVSEMTWTAANNVVLTSFRGASERSQRADLALRLRAAALSRDFLGTRSDETTVEGALRGTFLLRLVDAPHRRGGSVFLASKIAVGDEASGEAFSHWTFEQSRGRVLVCAQCSSVDRDSAKKSSDGAAARVVHTAGGVDAEGGLGLGNDGTMGMARFFLNHRCGRRCAELGLTRSIAPERSVGFGVTLASHSPASKLKSARRRSSAVAQLAAHIEVGDGRELAPWLPRAAEVRELERRCLTRVGARVCATESEWRAARRAQHEAALRDAAFATSELLTQRVCDVHACVALAHLHRLEAAVHIRGRGWVERAARCRKRVNTALALAGGPGVALARQLRSWANAMGGSGATLFNNALVESCSSSRSSSKSSKSSKKGDSSVHGDPTQSVAANDSRLDFLEQWAAFVDKESCGGRQGEWGWIDIAAPDPAPSLGSTLLWYGFVAAGAAAAARWLLLTQQSTEEEGEEEGTATST